MCVKASFQRVHQPQAKHKDEFLARLNTKLTTTTKPPLTNNPTTRTTTDFLVVAHIFY
jgi:hypothetical protein